MSQNQELVSFPFTPYLAKYLYHLVQNQPVETDDGFYKHLDVNMSSPDARFIRIVMQRKQIPGLQASNSRGFRFTIRIPKYVDQYADYVEDSRTKAIWIDEQTAKIIHDHFDSRFRDHFCSFISGAIFGANGKRTSLKKSITFFMQAYGINKYDGINYEQLLKIYKRKISPLKQPIYTRVSANSAENPKTSA
jgi:hypothetical protein